MHKEQPASPKKHQAAPRATERNKKVICVMKTCTQRDDEFAVVEWKDLCVVQRTKKQAANRNDQIMN